MSSQMDHARSSGSGSGNSGTYTTEAAETLRFEEEIQSLMTDDLSYHNGIGSPPSTGGGGGSYFTALLGLPPVQAVELLHDPDHVDATAAGAADSAAGSGGSWRIKALRVPPGCSPTFPSNAALVERAARFSVFAAEEPPTAKPKAEPEDSDPPPQRPAKRKEMERSKGRGTSKKSRTAAEENTGGEQLPYVHVRARRGQATDSHSLAERARREKINARMKLLQELVPGCSKITGTALVLDEIINHVQSLQRHVEFLSMRLAAVNPRIDYCGVDSFLTVEQYRRLTANNGRSNGMLMEQPLLWAEEGSHEGRRPNGWHVDMQQHCNDRQEPVDDWERDNAATPHEFINPSATSLFPPESATSASLSNQLKAEHKW